MENACGDKQFDEHFREMMGELFPESPLAPLPPAHAIWFAAQNIPPDFKTLVISERVASKSSTVQSTNVVTIESKELSANGM